MRHGLSFYLFLWVLALSVPSYSQSSADSTRQQKSVSIVWKRIQPLPGKGGKIHPGLSGAYSGFIGNKLVIVGGSNFPDNTPWRGGQKVFYQSLYTIQYDKGRQWSYQELFLPEPMGYGVSIQLPKGFLCIGGCNTLKCFDKVYYIHRINNHIVSSAWPSLPTPLANATGALVDDKIYIAGGQESMQQQEATHHFFVLDLKKVEKGWEELKGWPGENRGYAVSAAQYQGKEKCFFLFSGRNYHADGTMKVLNDGYVYSPLKDRWEIVSGMFPVMAGTAIARGRRQIWLLGGVEQLIPGSDTHPGFFNGVRSFDTAQHLLSTLTISPYPIAVTTHTLYRGNKFYIVCGELKPGIRTPYILSGTITER